MSSLEVVAYASGIVATIIFAVIIWLLIKLIKRKRGRLLPDVVVIARE